MLRVALWPLAGLAGTSWQLLQPQLWAAEASVAAAAAGALLLAVAWRGRGRLALGLVALAVALLGAAVADGRARLRLAEALDPALEGQDLQLVGTVARLPQSNLAGTRFVLAVESAWQRGSPVPVPPRLALGWYRGPDVDALLLGPDDLRAGQRWRLPVRLRQPHGNANPHGFDAELWWWEQGLRATGYVRSRAGDPAVRLGDAVAHPVERMRQAVRDRIDAAVPDAAAAGVLAALAIGDQGAIDRADWDLFRVTGVAHLMSISGLHVTGFAWLAALLVGWLWRRATSAMLWLPAPVAARWGGLGLALGYAVLSGFGVPAQRTVWMLAAVVLLRSLARRWPAPLLLPPVAGVVVLADPWALLQPGFWLSFCAVALLMLAEPAEASPEPLSGESRARRWTGQGWVALRGALRTQAVATAGLAPLTLVFFQQLSLVGFAANLLAIPVVTFLITPLALAGVALPAAWSAGAALVEALLQLLRAFAQWPWAQWITAAAPPWASVLGLVGGILLVLPLPWRLRLAGVPLMLPLLAPLPERPAEGRFELVSLDVGQGSAVLVRTRQHLLVYDTGPLFGLESDAGQRLLLPLLRARGESRVDLLMLSHRDSDHVGGAASLLARLPVAAMSSSLDAAHPLRAGAVPHRPCLAGERWQWDGVDFELLHPGATELAAGGRANALSCVLRVSGAQGSALLTGDIERLQELALVDRAAPSLRSDVLLVPHHGSRSSSSLPFVDAVAPRVALVQAGYRSRFGHPAIDVVERYTARGIAVVRSDACGAWTWAPDGRMACERDRSRRYWHHPGPVPAAAAGRQALASSGAVRGGPQPARQAAGD